MSRTGPRTVASTSPGVTHAPSAAPNSTRDRPSLTIWKTAAATGRPATTPTTRGTRSPLPTSDAGTVATVVTSPVAPRSSSRARRTTSSKFMGSSLPVYLERAVGPQRHVEMRPPVQVVAVGEIVAPVRTTRLLAEPRDRCQNARHGVQISGLPALRTARYGASGRQLGQLTLCGLETLGVAQHAHVLGHQPLEPRSDRVVDEPRATGRR